MNKLLLLVALAFPIAVAASSIADAQTADDAGAGSGSGSAAPAPAPSPAPIVAPVNPATNPNGYISELQNAEQSGWPVLVLVAAFGLCELLAAAGSKIAVLAWLGTGRVSIVIGGLVSVTTAMINKLANGGTWASVILGALVPASALFAHPAAADVAAKRAAKSAPPPTPAAAKA